ncbi:MAG: HAMP domain-containing histidine kinase, partial [Deltaproteobacteria bacterium]|nr:HAMP domain-containing histidine kinase [Deltaproteobacteria bacterium]
VWPTPSSDDAPVTDPCLTAAEVARTALDVEEVARIYVVGCRAAALPVRLTAASEAATLLWQSANYKAALAVLDASGVPADLSLRDASTRGIALFRVVNLRQLRAELLLQLGRTTEALDALFELGLEITALDAPDAEQLLSRVRQPIKQFQMLDRRDDALRLEQLLRRAERRVEAYNEIRDRILEPSRGDTSEDSRFIYDQYSETPYLLYYSWNPTRDAGVALQLEQSLLVQDFLGTEALRSLRPWLTVTDASGDWIAGVRRGGPIAVSVPFTRTLAHLRIGVRQEAIDRALQEFQFQWVTPLAVVCMCGVLGGISLWAQSRASLQQAQLLARQREFTTRVTHELKTPLAGIRVMAENLESGAWSRPDQIRDASRRIQQEADRLTARVDQVLAVARTRTIPNPEPFDPEEALLLAIDDWGPRLEQAGVRLHADLQVTDPVRGDRQAITDAVACLLDNALKYRRQGAESQVWLALSQHDDKVVVEVTDNGIGVPPPMRAAIFDRFVRVEGPNRGTAGGHGLGLSQVREIAETHGGTVVCAEGRDGGARFTMLLPAHT